MARIEEDYKERKKFNKKQSDKKTDQRNLIGNYLKYRL